MRSTELQKFRARLLDARNRLVRETDRVRESIPDEVHPPGEHEIAPSEGLDVDSSLEQEDTARLHEIDAALQRIKDGTFGTCSRCGAAIALARLDALPSASNCVSCEQVLAGSGNSAP